MNKTIVIGGDVSLINTIDGDISLISQEDGQGEKVLAPLGWVGEGVPRFEGMEITPTKQTQTVGTVGQYCTGDVTINPIPEQYELYNWMGSQAEFVSTVYPTA